MNEHFPNKGNGPFVQLRMGTGNFGPPIALVIDWVTGPAIFLAAGFISTKLKTMPASLYIVVEGDDPGYDIFVNGHALARNEDALEQLARRLQVRSLLDFFSADENSMALLLEQGAGNPEWAHHLPQPQWFDGTDGLKTVRAFLDFLAGNPAALGSETQLVLGELREYERVLSKTSQFGLRWHIAVSWR